MYEKRNQDILQEEFFMQHHGENNMFGSKYFLKENKGTKAHLEVKAIYKEPEDKGSFPGPDTL